MQKITLKIYGCALAALVCASLAAAPKFSPETSSLFVDFEPNGDVRDVCCGTNIGNSREYYDKRRRITGDLHGQAPLIWCCAALAEYVRPAK